MQAILLFLSDLIIPLFIVVILMSGFLNRHNAYADFVKGAKKGLMTAVDILPTLAGLMVAVGILRASGLLDALTRLSGNWMEHIGFPSQLVPLAVVRMFSSSAATGLLLDVYEQFGTDSRIGRIASVMMSSSETIFYTMSIYFMTVKVKKTRWTLAGALVATIAGITASTILAS
ncbi:spore maturation protein [Eubacterium ramulus]|uniref:Spore maturation protein n=1 Tax=Eubacterium ramulus TaxID=39490 RepID=A0A2V1JXX8_EUBRA|nr:nucleoside recognition domain-containing protein [Eubacterium ramulus]PWE87408.1 spore maturation protein [Eubacterium ramulus]